MRVELTTICMAAAAVALSAGRADAQREDDAGFGATAEVEQPLPAGAGDDPSAASTVVDVEDRPHAFDTLDELTHEVPGAQAWVTGAYGSFRTLSLRGADGEHTTVLLGDLPLAPEGEGFDLSTVPVTLLERIEVYRGGAPLWLGAEGIGGVLRLLPRGEERSMAELAAGAGSFGLVHGRIAAAVVGDGGSPAWIASAGAVHSDGDFPFVYDPTGLVPGDEREVRRDNADVDEGHGLVHLRTGAAGGRLEAAVLGFGRTGGVPGPAVQVSHARRATARLAAVSSWTREGEAQGRARPPWRTRLSVGASYERDALSDRFGELGIGRPRLTDDRTLRLFALGAGEMRLAPWLAVAVLARGVREEHRPHDAAAAVQVPESGRWAGSVGAEARVEGRIEAVRIEIRPSARVRVARAELHEIALGREGRESRTGHVAPTLRLGAAVSPARGLALTASVATATRIPSFLELFGDRAFLLGDTRLRPEHAVSVDGGAIARGRLGPIVGSVEARMFALFTRDLVRYRRTAQNQAVPENVDRARTLGAELGARGDIGPRFGLSGAITWLAPEDTTLDRTLPLRPRIQTYLRPELRLGPAGGPRAVLFVDLVHVGSMFADPHNLVVVAARTLLGAGAAVRLWEGRVEIAVTGSDLTDRRPFDVLGFPLPGRSFELTVTARTEAL